MMRYIRLLGRHGIGFLKTFGKASLLLFSVIFCKPNVKSGYFLLIKQLFSVGVLSFIIIVVSALFIGMVLALQGHHILSTFGASQALGEMIALSLSRELGPVVAALLFAGRACSALTAEIGLMKATDQLSCMAMMGVDPVKRVVAPRFWAGVISMPVLALIFSAVAILGGYWVGVMLLGVDPGSFWGNMQDNVDFRDDVVNGIIKSAVFGLVCTWIALFQGYACVPTAEGIARATTRTVVYASLAVLGLDFFLTAVMFTGV